MPLKAWVKSALDQVVQVYLKQPDLEFIWVGDDAVDPLEQAQTLQILVGAGIKTREEARADLGLAPEGGKRAADLGKFNPYHDERGRFTTPEGTVGPNGATQPAADAVASLKPMGANPRAVSTDALDAGSDGGADVQIAQGPVFEPPAPPEEPPALPPKAPPESAEPVVPPKGTIADAVAPNGVLPGDGSNGLGNPRTMPASDVPDAAALHFVVQIYNGRTPIAVQTGGNLPPGAFVAEMPDGTFITYRPAGQSGYRTSSATATVEINSDTMRLLSNGQILKLKFPQK